MASYSWNFGDGTTGTGSPVDHPYATAGTREVTLTVTDNEGGTGATTKQVKTIAKASPSWPQPAPAATAPTTP